MTIKYPLNIDRNHSRFKSKIMRNGGLQLLEILEKEFPLKYIKINKEKMEITDSQIKRLESWLENDCDVFRVVEELNYKEIQSVTSLFYDGAGILAKLLKIIDIEPINVNNEFKSKYDFINIEIINNDIGIMVLTKLNIDNFPLKNLYLANYLFKYFFYEKSENSLIKLDETNEKAKDLVNMYNITNTLTESFKQWR